MNFFNVKYVPGKLEAVAFNEGKEVAVVLLEQLVMRAKIYQMALEKLYLKKITGKAEIWLDGKLIGKKSVYEAGDLTLPLPEGQGYRQINMIVEGEADKPAGIDGLVKLEKR